LNFALQGPYFPSSKFVSVIYYLQRKPLAFVSVFGKRLYRKKNNVIILPVERFAE
jgi:hypothetical protein